MREITTVSTLLFGLQLQQAQRTSDESGSGKPIPGACRRTQPDLGGFPFFLEPEPKISKLQNRNRNQKELELGSEWNRQNKICIENSKLNARTCTYAFAQKKIKIQHMYVHV